MTELGQHRIFPDFKRQRARMVKLLEEQGITDEAVLAAMRTVRRHLFVPEALQGRAYEDHALPIGFGQTISQPYIVAFMSQLLEAKPGMKVLEIGTGSGYQAAVLREMGLEVFTIERVRELYEAARELFPEGSPGRIYRCRFLSSWPIPGSWLSRWGGRAGSRSCSAYPSVRAG